MASTRTQVRTIRANKVHSPKSKDVFHGHAMQKVDFVSTDNGKPVKFSSLEPLAQGWREGEAGSAQFGPNGELIQFSRQNKQRATTKPRRR